MRCRSAVSACCSAVRQLGAGLGDVEHVDRLRRPSVAISTRSTSQPCSRDDAADAIQQPERVVGDDIENRVAARRLVVAVDDRREPRRPARCRTLCSRPRSRAVTSTRPATTSLEHRRASASRASAFSSRNRSSSVNWNMSSTRPFGLVIAWPRRMSMPNDDSTPQMFENRNGLSSVTTVSSQTESFALEPDVDVVRARCRAPAGRGGRWRRASNSCR